MARKLFSGIVKSSLEKFRKFGQEQKRRLRIKSLGGENEMFTKEKIEKMAKDAYVEGQAERARSILTESLNNIELGSPEMLGGKTAREYLTIFDQTIDILKKQGGKKESRADEKKVLKELNDKLRQLINLYSQLKKIVEQIEENNQQFIKIKQEILKNFSINIVLSSGKTISNIEEAVQYIKKANIKNGRNYKIEYLNEKEVNEIVGLLVLRRKYLLENKPNNKGIAQISFLINLMKLIVEDPNIIEEFKEKFGFNEDLTKDIKVKFEKEIEDKINDIEKALAGLIGNIRDSEIYLNDYKRLVNECGIILNKYPTLDKNYCTNFIDRGLEYTIRKAGKEKVEFALKYNQQLVESIIQSRAVDFTHQSFEELRQRTIALINEMIREGSKIGLKIEFDEENQKCVIYHPNKKEEFQIINDEALKAYNASKKQPVEKEKQKEQCKKECDELYKQYVSKIKDSINNLTYFFDPFTPIISSTYTLLNQNEINAIKIESKNRILNQFYAEYGEDYINYCIEFAKKVDEVRNLLNEILTNVDKIDDLKSEYEQVISQLMDIKNGIDHKYITKIEFDKSTGILDVEYANNKFSRYYKEIVPKELLAKMETYNPYQPAQGEQHQPQQNPQPAQGEQHQPQQNPQPAQGEQHQPQPNPKSTEEEEDIKLYVNLVKEINQKVSEINALNTRAFTGDLSDVEGVINSESQAQSLDKDVVNLRVNISKLRTDYLVKYKTYMLSNEEVKNAKIESIQFNGVPFESLVNFQDVLIQEAEERIIELANERKDKSLEEIAKINDEIKRILAYIEAKNSLVNRSLVEKCRQNPQYDLLAFLQKRRENKKEWREKLKMIKNNQAVPLSSQPLTPPLENEGPSVRMEVPNGTVDPNRRLVFNPRKKAQLVNKEKDFIGLADSVTISLINSGIKVKYSQQLKQKLSALNAKLSLVNKQNYRVRTSQKITDESDEQEIRFKDQRDILSNDEYKNYKVEIRVPSESGKSSDILYEYDFDDQEPHFRR